MIDPQPETFAQGRWTGAALMALVLLAYAAASFLPKHALWGYHYLAYLPPVARIAGIGFAALVLSAPAGWLEGFCARTRTRLVEHGWLVIGVLGVSSALAFYLLPIQGTVYGDARNMESWYGDNRAFDVDWILDVLRPRLTESKEALTVGIHRTVSHVFGIPIRHAYRLLGAASGTVVIVSYLSLIRREPSLTRYAAPLGLSVLVLGGNQLFFGHVENYAFAVMVSSLFLIAAFRFFDRAAPTWLLVVLWLVAARAHGAFFCFLPAVLFALIWRFRAHHPGLRRLTGWTPVLGLLVLPPIVAGILAYFFLGFQNESYAAAGDQIEALFLPLVQPPPPLRNYTLFSPNHLVDLLNVLPLVAAPVVFQILAWVTSYRRQVSWSHPRLIFFSLALFFPLVLFTALNPALSMPRDWDLYGLLYAPVLFWFTALVAHTSHAPAQASRSLAIALAIGVFTVAGFMVNASGSLLSRRLEDVGEHVYRTYYTGASHLIHTSQKMEPDLREQLARREGTLNRLTPWKNVDDFEYAVLLATAGALHSRLGDNETAADRFERALVVTTHMPSLHWELAQLYLLEGKPRPALAHVVTHLRRNPARLEAIRLGARAALAAGDTSLVRQFVQGGLQQAPGDSALLHVQEEAQARGLLR